MVNKPLIWGDINPFDKCKIRRVRLGQLLIWLKNEDGKSSFDEMLVEFLELLLDEMDHGLAI